MKLFFKFLALICILQTNVLISSISVDNLKNSNQILFKQNPPEIPKVSKQRNPQHGNIYSSNDNLSYKSEASNSVDDSLDSSDNSSANNYSEKINDLPTSLTVLDNNKPQYNSGIKHPPFAIDTATNSIHAANSLSALTQQHQAGLTTNSQSLKSSGQKATNPSFTSTSNTSTSQGTIDLYSQQIASPNTGINQQGTAPLATKAIPVITQPILFSPTLNNFSNTTPQQLTRNQTSLKLIPDTQEADGQDKDHDKLQRVFRPSTNPPILQSPLNKSNNHNINIYSINKINSKSSNNYTPAKATINLKASASIQLGICYAIINNYIFDLTPLAKLNQSNFVIKSQMGKTINFSICGDLSTNKCSKQFSLVASDDCEKYAGSSAIEKSWLLDNEGESSKLILQLPEGDNCSKVTYEIACKPDKIFEIVNISEFYHYKCEKTIMMESKHACAAGVYTLWYSNFKFGNILIATIMLILGLFFLIYGTRFSNYSLTVILGLSISFIFYFLFKNSLQINFTVYLLIGYLIAILIPIIDDRGKSLHKLCCNVILGFLISTLLYIGLVPSFKVNSDVLYWILFFGVCTASLTLWTVIGQYIISLSTTLVGSYLIVRAFGIYFNNYPDEILMSNFIQKREYNQFRRNFTNVLLVYLCAIVGIWLLGIFIQNSINKEYQKKHEKEKLIENEIGYS